LFASVGNLGFSPRMDLVARMCCEAQSHRLEGRLDQASESLGKCITVLTNNYKVQDVGQLVDVVLKTKGKEDRKAVAAILDSYGNVLRGLKKGDEYVRQLLEAGLKLRRNNLIEYPDDDETGKKLVAQSLSSLAMFYNALKMRKEADKVHLEALELFAQVPLHTKQSRQTLAILEADQENKRVGDENQELTEWEKFRDNKLRVLENEIKQKVLTVAETRPVEETKHHFSGLTDIRQESRPEYRLVLQSHHVETFTDLLTPVDVAGETPTDEQTNITKEMDAFQEQVPRQIVLDHNLHDIVHFGRQTYKDALGFYCTRGEGSKRKIGYVRLDSSIHDRLVSRRHAQIKFSRVHSLLSTQTNNMEIDALGSTQKPRQYSSDSSSNEDDQVDSLLAWVIRDLDSTNGVLINGTRIQESPLRHGDIISFGGATSVDFGCAVLTHKRKPVHSVFVYRFEEVGKSTPSMSCCKPKSSPKHFPQAPLHRFVQSFEQYYKRHQYRKQMASESELFHFFMLYMSIYSVLFPEHVSALKNRNDSRFSNHGELESILLNAVRESAVLHNRAVERGIPYMHWANWLRAEMSQSSAR